MVNIGLLWESIPMGAKVASAALMSFGAFYITYGSSFADKKAAGATERFGALCRGCAS